jgi:hypothetical protein
MSSFSSTSNSSCMIAANPEALVMVSHTTSWSGKPRWRGLSALIRSLLWTGDGLLLCEADGNVTIVAALETDLRDEVDGCLTALFHDGCDGDFTALFCEEVDGNVTALFHDEFDFDVAVFFCDKVDGNVAASLQCCNSLLQQSRRWCCSYSRYLTWQRRWWWFSYSRHLTWWMTWRCYIYSRYLTWWRRWQCQI